MKEFASIIQTLIWAGVILWLVGQYRDEIRKLAKGISARIESGGGIELGPVKLQEFRAELDTVHEAVSSMDSKIAALFMATMSPLMYVNLKKIGSGHFGPYRMSNGLERELYHLRDIGYITVHSIKQIASEGANLSDYVQITPAGKQFIDLREAADSTAQRIDSDATMGNA